MTLVCSLTGLKGKHRAQEKLDKDYEGVVNRLTDVCRITLKQTTCARLVDALNFLRSDEAAKLGLRILELKNKFAKPTPMGYRDFNTRVGVTLDDGGTHICEIQLNLIDMLTTKDDAHDYYEQVRWLLRLLALHVWTTLIYP